MAILKNEVPERIERKNRSFKSRWAVLALALLAALFALPSAPGTLLADGDGLRGHFAEITFTKWLTTFPDMAGVVGGDVGTGTFVGEVLDFRPVSESTSIEALYHINGGTHSLTAHVYVMQDDLAHTAMISGEVIDGWLRGRRVSGNYMVISCTESVDGVCFQGVLRIHMRTERRDAG